LPKAARQPETEPRFLDGYLPYLMAQAAWLISGRFQRHLATKGIRFSVWRLLASLVGTAGLTIGELADELLLQQPTVTRIVDRLAGDGLVARKSSPHDRRRVIVVLTARGRNLVAGLIKEAVQHQNEMLAAYSKSEIELLFRVMRNVLGRNGAAMERG
jgi:MarR family transcriptional regulator, organic hydroperoxide resistance regulator